MSNSDGHYTLRDVIDRLEEVRTTVNDVRSDVRVLGEKFTQHQRQTEDHELRLRKLERALWIVAGAAAAGGGGVASLLSRVLG